MKNAIRLLLISAALVLGQSAPELFLEKPYLQLGDAPALSAAESLVVMWHTAGTTANSWTVDVKTSKDRDFRLAEAARGTLVDSPGIPPHFVYRAKLTALVPGEMFRYRVSYSGRMVFEAEGQARKAASQAQKFALFGDCAQGTVCQRMIAAQVHKAKPDFVFITGDIVYGAGRITEYRSKFFPVYNADQASPEGGAPLLRSIPFIAAPGNHDTALRNLETYTDALAYFLYWDQPLNGPKSGPLHVLQGTPAAKAAVLAGAGERYPAMANFSFDYGNAHWTVLDANPYTDWNDPALKAWVVKDLESAKNATWRFVAFHHPGFNSSKSHFQDQWMRWLSPVFEAGKVDIVFSGHVHNYQRSYPLKFVPKAQADGKLLGPKGEVAGDWTLNAPGGVVYIVSGAGGAALYNPEQQGDASTMQPFTAKYIADQHSFTLVEIDGGKLRMKQVSEHGYELDSLQLSK